MFSIKNIINNYTRKTTKTKNAENITNPIISSVKHNNHDFHVFHHHIYEFKKGLRNLVLTTEKTINRKVIEDRLTKENIDFIVHNIAENKINVYFGKKACIDVIKTFDKKLSKLSPEQDFLLGTMLGYDRLQQCDRYLKMRAKNHNIDSLVG